MTTTAKELAAAWGATFTQHNLLSTATAEQRNAFIERNIDTYNRLCCPILDAPDAPAPSRTPILDANMQKLTAAGGDRAQLAARITFVFVACENIADFAANRSSKRHMDEWIKGLIDNAKAIRVLAAHMEEAAARASVADQQRHEAQRNPTAANMPTELLGRILTLSDLTDSTKDVIMDELDARKYDQRASLLSPEEDAMIAELAGQPQRRSSVDYLYSYNPETHPEAAEEVGQTILRNAADHLYNRQPQPVKWETADKADASTVDLLDDLRGMDWGDLKLGAADPRNDRPSTDADSDEENDDSKPEPQD